MCANSDRSSDGASAAGGGSVACGSYSQASSVGSTAVGYGSAASSYGSTSYGAISAASGYGSTALGPASRASGIASTATGAVSTASGDYSTALGTYSQALGSNAIAIGGNERTGAGNAAYAGGAGAVAIGDRSVATAPGGVALGQGSVADRGGMGGVAERFSGTAVSSASGAVSVGAAGAERQIANVAGGVQATDAVNVRQLQAVGGQLAGSIGGGARFDANAGTYSGPSYGLRGTISTFTDAVSGIQAIAGGAAGAVQYATPGTPSNALNLVGAGGTVRLGNLAAGAVAAGSTQAINGAQLFETNRQVAANAQGIATTSARAASALGGGAGVDANGLLTAPRYTIQGGTYDNVGGALGALDTATTANTRGIAANAQAIGVVAGQTATNTASIAELQNGSAGPFRNNNTGGYAAPVASGADAVAGGFGSVASGQQSTAIGTGARATQAGAVAIGAFARATADPTTAVGFAAAATGDEASAFGAFATAAGKNGTALGRSADAAGANSVAVGVGASARQANGVAIGAGVTTTRANQVAIGTAEQTYTLAGLASARSSGAQSGATGFVTADAAGNLATSNYGPAQLAQMDGRISSLESRVAGAEFAAARLQRQVRGAFSGTAIALSLSGAVLPEGKNYAVAGGVGTYSGSTGVGFTGIVRVNDNLFASGGVGFGTGERSTVGGRGSLMYAW